MTSATSDTWNNDRRQLEFVRARRHTLFVRFMRLALPATTLLICSGIVYFSGLLSDSGPTLQISGIGIENGTVTMENARLTGVDDDDRSYVVNAESASQKLSQPGVFELDNIDAQISGDETGWANVVAENGQYDRDRETLRLDRNVRVQSGDGYDVLLESAFVDLQAGTVTSDDPVVVEMMNGTVRAQGLIIEDQGQTIRFFNGVSLNFTPGGASGNTGPSGTDAAPNE